MRNNITYQYDNSGVVLYNIDIDEIQIYKYKII